MKIVLQGVCLSVEEGGYRQALSKSSAFRNAEYGKAEKKIPGYREFCFVFSLTFTDLDANNIVSVNGKCDGKSLSFRLVSRLKRFECKV